MKTLSISSARHFLLIVHIFRKMYMFFLIIKFVAFVEFKNLREEWRMN